MGFRGDLPVTLETVSRAAEEETRATLGPFDSFKSGLVGVQDIPSPSKHRAKRQKQWECWTTEILPLILPHYLEFQRKTRSLHDKVLLDVRGQNCACCQTSRKLTIWVIRFSSMCLKVVSLSSTDFLHVEMEQIELWVSDCAKAAVQLLQNGLFPCSPVYPTIAIDI